MDDGTKLRNGSRFSNKQLKYEHVAISHSRKMLKNLLFQNVLGQASKYSTVAQTSDSCEIQFLSSAAEDIRLGHQLIKELPTF